MEKFVFVHVHKTGGMSLFSALSDVFGKDSCLRFANGGIRDAAEFEKLSAKNISRLRLISGHFFYPTFRRKVTIGWTPIIVVRDPLARLVSAYNYMSQSFHELSSVLSKVSFEEYYDLITHRVDSERNIQCQYVCGSPDFESAYEFLRVNKFIFSSLDNLSTIFDEISERTGHDISCREINTSTKRTEFTNISPELRQRIIIENMDDYKLYWLIDRLSSSKVNAIY
jgi:hypothetical protein